MRFPLASFIALSLVSFAAVAADPPSVIVIRAGKLIDVAQGRVLENQTIVVRGDRIETVGASAAPEGAKVIDLSSYTVLPGLIDRLGAVRFVVGDLTPIVAGATAVLVTAVVYLAASWRLGVPESRQIVGLLVRRRATGGSDQS